jgi:hypothetical protein
LGLHGLPVQESQWRAVSCVGNSCPGTNCTYYERVHAYTFIECVRADIE